MKRKSYKSGTSALLFIVLVAVAIFAIWYFNSPAFKDVRNEIGKGQVAAGWTSFTKPAATEGRIVYVSNSKGNDTNNGLTEDKPVKTISKGITLLVAGRTLQSNGTFGGRPDWLLLKKGDTWNNENFGNWKLSGASETHPVLISSYCPSGSNCSTRPKVNSGGQIGWYASRSTGARFVNNVAIVGIEFTGTGDSGIKMIMPGQNLLIEDVEVDGYTNNINMSIQDGALSNFKIRRSVIADSFSTSIGSDAMIYASNVHGITIEENIIDHSGTQTNLFRPSLPGHDIYLQSTVSNAVVQGNIIANAPSHGLQARGGATITNNLFLRNPISVLIGKGAYVLAGGVTGDIGNNVFLEGIDKPSNTAVGGWGLDFGNTKPNGNTRIHDNIFANVKSVNSHQPAISTDTIDDKTDPDQITSIGTNSVTIENNIVYNWNFGFRIGRGLTFGSLGRIGDYGKASGITIRNNNFINSRYVYVSQHGPAYNSNYEFLSNNNYYNADGAPKFSYNGSENVTLATWRNSVEGTATNNPKLYKDPNRTIESYHASLGKSANAAAFIQEAWKQSKDNWRQEYTADAVNTYIRAGFGLLIGLNPPLQPLPPAPAPTSDVSVTNIKLYNSAGTDTFIKNIVDGETITVSPGTTLSIVAEASAATKSVTFSGNGGSAIQSTVPFALAGDTDGNLNSWPYTPGTRYTITIMPYPAVNAGGTVGTAKTIRFTISTGGGTLPSSTNTVTGFVLYNAITNAPIRTIANGETILLSSLPTSSLTIVALTTSDVESVKFGVNSNPSYKIESFMPYTIAGKNGANLKDVLQWSFTKGTLYTVTATPYSADSGGGSRGTAKTIQFKFQ